MNHDHDDAFTGSSIARSGNTTQCAQLARRRIPEQNSMNKLLNFHVPCLVIGVVFLLSVLRIEGFSGSIGGLLERPLPRGLTAIKAQTEEGFPEDNGDFHTQGIAETNSNGVDRRSMIRSTIAMSAVIVFSDPVRSSAASAMKSNPDFKVELDCLKDLPPIPEDSVRIYLCRHGQTENNRLRIVQGSRVDPPVNVNGKAQATNLGLALAQANPKPDVFFSSSLLRARMTAEIAANVNSSSASDKNRIIPKQLPVLAEVDFGPIADGQPISVVQEKMAKTYTKWSMGDVDYRPEGGGDSGREVCSWEIYSQTKELRTISCPMC